MRNFIPYIAIAIFVIIVCTAIYIGRQLYKEKVRKDLENSSKRRERELELELELGPLPDKVVHESLKKITPKSSLENSSTASSSQGKGRKSSFNIESNSKSLDRIVKSRRPSIQDSVNGSSKLVKSRRPSIQDGSVNGSSKYSTMSDFRYSRRVSKASPLVIKIPNEIPPPPPPSPLKSQDDSVKTLTNNIIPSDISGSTYTPPLISSKTSSPTDLKTHSLMSSQPTTHVNHPEFELA